MASQNSGTRRRFENGALVYIASTSNPILNLVPGSLTLMGRQRERVTEGSLDRGVLGDIIVGDQRPQEIDFDLYNTPNLQTLIESMLPAATTGKETFFTLIIKEPNYDGASAGTIWTFTKCYLPDGDKYKMAGSGQSVDVVSIHILDNEDRIVPTTY